MNYPSNKSRLWLEYCGNGKLPQYLPQSRSPIRGTRPWGPASPLPEPYELFEDLNKIENFLKDLRIHERTNDLEKRTRKLEKLFKARKARNLHKSLLVPTTKKQTKNVRKGD